MLGRRGFMGLLALLPLGGAAAANKETHGIETLGDYDEGPLGVPIPKKKILTSEQKRWQEIYSNRQRRLHAHNEPTSVPHKYNAMRSWSPTFRIHCYHADQDALEREMGVKEDDWFNHLMPENAGSILRKLGLL